MSELESEAPPVGEEIHVSGSSMLPFVMAIGITLMVIGTTINFFLSVVGAIIFLITLFRWIRDTRRDMADLPEDGH